MAWRTIGSLRIAVLILFVSCVVLSASAFGGQATQAMDSNVRVAALSATTGCFGDLTGDNERTPADLDFLANMWRQSAGPPHDLDGDGLITVLDMQILAALLGVPCPPVSSMDQRLNQVIEILEETEDPDLAEAAIDLGMEILYGGMRPLPSKDMGEVSAAAFEALSQNELRFATALKTFAQRKVGTTVRGRALGLALFVEQMNEVAEAVGRITIQCGVNDTLAEEPCNDLHPLLDEQTGREIAPGSLATVIAPGYAVQLRSPFIPVWGRHWDENVFVTRPLSPGECTDVVFQETKGLMLRLHLERIIVVADPWVSVFGVPRRTEVPIWRLEWVPSEYVKMWHVCNDDGQITKSVTQRVKQDIPLNYFWRYYP